jgi:adenylate kinase family enzyme
MSASPRVETLDSQSAPVVATHRRILVLGCSGAGKSTLSRRLGAALGLPVIHLDQLYWNTGWVECSDEEMRAKVAAVVATDAWVIDGNYSRFLPERIPRADTIVFLDIPRIICLASVLKRVAQTYGRTRADMAPGCPEKFDLEFFSWIWGYPKRSRPGILALLEQRRGHCAVHHLRSRAETHRLVEQLRQTSVD